MKINNFLIRKFSDITLKIYYVNERKIFYKGNGDSSTLLDESTLFIIDLEKKTLWVSYSIILKILENRYGMKRAEIQKLITDMVIKHLKINPNLFNKCFW